MSSRENLSVFISLNNQYFNTHEFLTNKTIDTFQDSNIVYIPLSQSTFKNIFHTDTGLSDSENAKSILTHLQSFFNPNIFNNNVTFANQLGEIITSFYDDVQLNMTQLATDVASDGPLFNYFFTSNSMNYTKYENQCFDNTIEYLQYTQTHDPNNCVLCQPLEELTDYSTDCTPFMGEYVAGTANADVLYLLSSQLRGIITLHAETYDEAGFWDKVGPADAISIHTKLFIPSSEGSNELHLVLKFHIVSPSYNF